MHYSLSIVCMWAVQFHFAKVYSDCGSLVILNGNNLPAGNTFRLKYTWRENYKTRVWQHSVDGNYANISLIGERHEELEQEKYYVLKIMRSVIADRGPYRVVCGRGKYTNVETLHVPTVPPGKPQFLEVRTLGTCVNCIKAIVDHSRDVTCVSHNGSLPANITIYKHGARQTTTPKLTYDPTSISATYTFVATAADHGRAFRCQVTNDAASPELTAEARVYVVKNPSKVTVSATGVVRGSMATFSCVSYGGRPDIPVRVMGQVNFTQNSTSANCSENDTYTVTTTYRKRLFSDDNNKLVSCCSEDVELKQRQTCAKDIFLNVTFPPLTALLREQRRTKLDGGYTNIKLHCWLSESNPNTTALWSNNGNVPIDTLSTEYTERHQGCELDVKAAINVCRTHNGLVITCSAANLAFPTLQLNGTYTVNITFAPIITIEPGKQNITVYEGDDVRVTCSVDSNPPSNISWTENAGKLNTNDVDDSPGTRLLLIYNVSHADAGVYRCFAQNSDGSAEALVDLIVKDRSLKPPERKRDKEAGGVIGAVLGTVCALLLLAGFAVIVVIVVRRRRNKDSAAVQIEIEEREPSVNPQAEDPMYNNTQSGQGDGEAQVYASVIPKAQRVNQQQESNATAEESSGLMYVDLDFPSRASTSKQQVRRVESQVEYTTIDATRRGTPLPDDE